MNCKTWEWPWSSCRKDRLDGLQISEPLLEAVREYKTHPQPSKAGDAKCSTSAS